MPIVNGRVHVERRKMPPRHRVAYIGGVTAAVAIVVGGWALTVGSQLHSFIDGVKTSMVAASETVAHARASANEAVPKLRAPDLAAALHAAVAQEDTQEKALPVAAPKTP